MSGWKLFWDQVAKYTRPFGERALLRPAEYLSEVPLLKRVLLPAAGGVGFGLVQSNSPEEAKRKALVYGLAGGALGGLSPTILRGLYDAGWTLGRFFRSPLEMMHAGWVTSSPVAHKGGLPLEAGTFVHGMASKAREETAKQLAQQLRLLSRRGDAAKRFEEATWHLLDYRPGSRRAVSRLAKKFQQEYEKLFGIEAALKGAGTNRKAIKEAIKAQRELLRNMEGRAAQELLPYLRSVNSVTTREKLLRGDLASWAGELSRLGWTGTGPFTKYLPVGRKAITAQFLLMGPAASTLKLIRGEEAPSNFLSSLASTAYLNSAFLPGVGMLGPFVGSIALGEAVGRASSPLDTLWRRPGVGPADAFARALHENMPLPIHEVAAMMPEGSYRGHFLVRYYTKVSKHFLQLARREYRKGNVDKAARYQALADQAKAKAALVAAGEKTKKRPPSRRSPSVSEAPPPPTPPPPPSSAKSTTKSMDDLAVYESPAVVEADGWLVHGED